MRSSTQLSWRRLRLLLRGALCAGLASALVASFSGVALAQGNNAPLKPIQRNPANQARLPATMPAVDLNQAGGDPTSLALPAFQLPPAEQQALDRLLIDWQNAGEKIRNFKADFMLREYEAGNLKDPVSVGKGYVSYQKPDKGEFNVVEKRLRNKAPKNQAELWLPPQPGEHFVCTGAELIEVQHPLQPGQKGKVIIRPIPKELQGRMIVFGPMPFVFGMKADDLKDRYSIRVVTKPAEVDRVVELQVRPQWSNDVQNYREVFVRLDKQTLDPQAVKLEHPNGTVTTYVFSEIQKPNAVTALFKDMFKAPSVPRNYERVVEEPAAAPQQSPAPAQPPRNNGIQPLNQAQQPAAPTGKRK